MSFGSWFKRHPRPASSPALAALIQVVVAYLSTLQADDEVRPKFVALATNETELNCLTALRLLAESGVTKQHFGVYCGNSGEPLQSFSNLEQIPRAIYCFTCDTEHTLEDKLVVEVYFTVNKARLASYLQSKAA